MGTRTPHDRRSRQISTSSATLGYVDDGELVGRLPGAVYKAAGGEYGDWLYASQQIEGILGFPPEDFLADPGLWARLLHPDDRDWVIAGENALSEAAGHRAVEYRMVRRDGRVVWVLDDARLMYDPDHGLLHLGLLYDISRRRRMETMLAQQASVVEHVAHGGELVNVLTDLAKATDTVSGLGRTVILLDATDDSARRLVVTCDGRVDEPPPGRLAVWSAPLPSSTGTQRGEVQLTYTLGDTPPDEDAELASWAARLAGLAAERVAHREETATSLSLLEATLESTADGILVVDAEGRIVGHNQKFREMWRIPAELLESRDDDSVIASVLDQLEDPAGFVDEVRRLYSTPESSSFDVLTFRDGRIYERYSQPQRLDGRSVGRVWSFRDMTAQRRLEEELRRQAFTDSLTPLPNRALFMARLTEALARQRPSGRHTAVLLVDLDDFKTVNDSLGHVAGDGLLITTAERLLTCLRSGHTAARLGGDEFVVLLDDLDDPADATTVARRILDTICRPVLIDGRVVKVQASVGIAFVEEGTDAGDLLRNADLAMYAAKHEGGSRSRTFRADMHADALSRLELKADLERAISRRELVVHYQPIFELATRHIIGVEALVRWPHPTRGMVGPCDFIPLAEETGLIDQIGQQVLEAACAQVARWRASSPLHRDLTVSVNISPKQLYDPTLIPRVRHVLDRTGLPPAALVLELTEGAFGESMFDITEALGQVRAQGIRLALDDFGTGHSSLARLDSCPLDIVKVDRSFVNRLSSDLSSSALLEAMLQLARALRMDMVAEGVETQTQLDRLQGLGYTAAQGYFLARPAAAGAITALLGAPAGAVDLPR